MKKLLRTASIVAIGVCASAAVVAAQDGPPKIGMTFQEIADLQGVPLSTVKTRLYQGLNVLRRHLQQQGKYDPATTKVS